MEAHFLGRLFTPDVSTPAEEGFTPVDPVQDKPNAEVTNGTNGDANGHVNGGEHSDTDGNNGTNCSAKRLFEGATAPRVFVDPTVSGFQRPTKFEGSVDHLEVYGEIPKEISGTFYRIMPDPMFPSYIHNDTWINGDGNVSAFRIKDGRVHFKQRYVNTEKLIKEKAAGKALMGRYRNPYTDLVDFRYRTVANTNIIYFRGHLLALKEDGIPYAVDPITLETKGVYDFEGQFTSKTFTAHPKYDVKTRELLTYGYEAKGLATRSICYVAIDNDTGKFNEEVWFEPPVCGMQHDFAITDNVGSENIGAIEAIGSCRNH